MVSLVSFRLYRYDGNSAHPHSDASKVAYDYIPHLGVCAFRTSQFTGKERDSESGLDYFGARYYGSALGRFTSPDWSASPEPIPYADFTNPQTLNQYAYLLSNPLAHPDPDGHCPQCLLGAVIGAAVNVGVTYFTKPNANRADYAGAALSGAITGAVAGATGGASLLVQVAVNAEVGAGAGIVERSVAAGHLEVGKPEEVLKDAAVGAAGPLLSAAGGKLAKAISGKDAEALTKASKGTSLGERHSRSLEKQAEAAKKVEESGRKAGDNAGRAVDGTNRAQGNAAEQKKERTSGN